ncbi:tyrosine-type recombinase/integrase [Roseinatronobacter bogoriensis]|uniref:Integrase n=1 Tax=Roseinatronobacter bogoriensis subsp. barguzinensis TaxID=441209 RepID=A0A2K8K7X9_9RHOB|nr:MULTISPECIES: site-specific integrase [Rhodobaca]ATX65549.1 integrase [Rhodobaca barguzinensis]MBB4209909.1 integrase [Rhodobaca bogoriensis DSM 18756]TDW32648.1 site-specific recombinase XerD [Rhodobaca barguzinensis]TDY65669.1 site-specific recombinase XerD [Rhodobaca bogoriensis DSM 18756]
MVKRLRLNDKTVREQIPEEDRDYQVFDTEIRGLSIRVMRSGERSFVLDYRFAGRQRRMAIGRWPEWTVTAARERARELRRQIDEGSDPLDERGALREAPRFNDMIDRYLVEHASTLAPLSASDHRSFLTKLVAPHWGNKLVADITPQDVTKLLNLIAQGRARPSKATPNNRARKLAGKKPTPVRANRIGEVLRKMFNLAIQWGWRSDNPAAGFKKRVETARERFLSQEEIGRLAEVLDAAEDQRAAGIIRICMLTGARVGEVRQARFEQFNLELGIWSKPASTTKQRKIHRVPISAEVAAIVRQRGVVVPKGNPWLFPGDVPGQPVKEIRRFWMIVQREANLPDVRIHDLRHTFASLLVSRGASLEMIGKLLGHSQIQTTLRYAHLMDSPLRAGVNAVAGQFRPRPKIVHDADARRA